MIAPHRMCYDPHKLMQHQGRWRMN